MIDKQLINDSINGVYNTINDKENIIMFIFLLITCPLWCLPVFMIVIFLLPFLVLCVFPCTVIYFIYDYIKKSNKNNNIEKYYSQDE